MNCLSPTQISVEVIKKKINKKPLEFILAEFVGNVRMYSPSSENKMVITKKIQTEKKEKHKDISEVFKKIRKSNRE